MTTIMIRVQTHKATYPPLSFSSSLLPPSPPFSSSSSSSLPFSHLHRKVTFFGSSSTAAFRSLTASERRPIPRNVIARALYTTPSLNPHWRDRSKSDNASTYLECMRIRQHVEHIEIREPVVVSHHSHAYALYMVAYHFNLSLSLSGIYSLPRFRLVM